MGRKPKPKSALDPRFESDYQKLPTTAIIPKDPGLRYHVIQALLDKIRRLEPQEANFLTNVGLRNLVAAERAKDKMPGGLGALSLSLALNAIRKGKPGNLAHHIPTLRIQQSSLLRYFQDHNFPKPSSRAHAEWIQAHKYELYKLLIPWGCYCEYRSSLDGLDLEKRDLIKTPGEAVYTLLAELHTNNATRSIMKKHLTRSSLKALSQAHWSPRKTPS